MTRPKECLENGGTIPIGFKRPPPPPPPAFPIYDNLVNRQNILATGKWVIDICREVSSNSVCLLYYQTIKNAIYNSNTPRQQKGISPACTYTKPVCILVVINPLYPSGEYPGVEAFTPYSKYKQGTLQCSHPTVNVNKVRYMHRSFVN